MGQIAKRILLFFIVVFNAGAFPTYFYFVYKDIPSFWDRSGPNIATGVLTFLSGLSYFIMLNWIVVACSDRPLTTPVFFGQVVLICFWGFCINIIQSQWILLAVSVGMMIGWSIVSGTCFDESYEEIPDQQVVEEPQPTVVEETIPEPVPVQPSIRQPPVSVTVITVSTN